MYGETAADGGDVENLELKVETEVMGDSVGWGTADKHSIDYILLDAVHFTSGAGTLLHNGRNQNYLYKGTEKTDDAYIHAKHCV